MGGGEHGPCLSIEGLQGIVAACCRVFSQFGSLANEIVRLASLCSNSGFARVWFRANLTSCCFFLALSGSSTIVVSGMSGVRAA